MPIKIKCACGKTFDLPDEMAGRKGKCAGCGAAIDVPAGLHFVHETVGRPLPQTASPATPGAAPAPGSGPRSAREPLSPQAQLYLVLGLGGGLIAFFVIALFYYGSSPPPPGGPDLQPAVPASTTRGPSVEDGKVTAFTKPIAGPGDVTVRGRVHRAGRAAPIELTIEIGCEEPDQILAVEEPRLEACLDERGRALQPGPHAPIESAGARAVLSFVPFEDEPSRSIRSASGAVDLLVSRGAQEILVGDLGAAGGSALVHPALEAAGTAVRIAPGLVANEIRLGVRRKGPSLGESLASIEFSHRDRAAGGSTQWSDAEGSAWVDFGSVPVPTGIEARLIVRIEGGEREVVLRDLDAWIGRKIGDPALAAAGIEVEVLPPRRIVRLEVEGGGDRLRAALEPAGERTGAFEWRVEESDLAGARLRLAVHSRVETVRVPFTLEGLEIPGEE